MPDINVDPEGLRKAGGDLNDAREELVDGSNAHLLHGIGDDQHISTAGYWPGVWAQNELTDRYNEAQEAFNNINNNFMAISSALHIVADVFESTDQAAALEFAFLNPDAEIPAGLPSYVDPEVNSAQLRERAEQEAAGQEALGGGGLPPGWTRHERATSPYSKVTEVFDASGTLVSAQHMTWVNGSTTTATYGRNNQLIGTSVKDVGVTGNHTVVRSYSGEATRENLTEEKHEVKNEDGSAHYYTDDYHGEGEPERTDEVTVAPEPTAALGGAGLVRHLGEQQYLAEAWSVRENAAGGFGPEDYEGPHNRTR